MNFQLHIILTLYLFFISCELSAQNTFQKRYGWLGDDEGRYVEQTFDGGYIVTGKILTFAGSYDVYLIKTNIFGDTLWTKSFGSLGGNDQGFSVQQTTDSGFIITGFANGGVNFDLYLIRTDFNGDTLWTKYYLGIDAIGYSIKQTFDGGFIIAGRTEFYGAGLQDVYLIKTDANGDSLWSRTYGGMNNDEARCVIQTSDSGFIVVGSTNSFSTGTNDIYMIKTDKSGNALWSRAIGDSAHNSAYCVQETLDRRFIVAGNTIGVGAIASYAFLMKTDTIGNIIWSKKYGGSNSGEINFVVQSSDSGFVFVGNANGDVWLGKTNSQGDTLWSKTIGEQYSERGNCINLTSDGGFIVTGTKNIFDSLSYDIFLIKTDSNGNSYCDESAYPVNASPSYFQVLTPATIVSIGGGYFNQTETDINKNRGNYITPICNTVDVRETINNNEILIYPNPTEGVVTIRFDNIIQKAVIIITDCIGRIVFSEQLFNSKEKEVDLNNFAKGLYFVRIIEKEIQFIKLFVIH